MKPHPDFVPTAPSRRPTLTVINGGGHRGAHENLRAFVDFNRLTAGAAIVPVYADPAPGRALAMKTRAVQQGVLAHAIEARVEDALTSGDIDALAPIVLNLDRASSVASVLRSREAEARCVLGYMLVRLPNERLLALRFVLEPHDTAGRAQAIAFFEQLAAASERGSSSAVLGADANPAHRLAEPAIRRWFGDHCAANLAKIVAGVEPVSHAFEVTTNGKDTTALHIVAGASWSDPRVIAEAIFAAPVSPLRRGSQFVVAEVTPQGIRLHEARYRTDDRLTVRRAEDEARVTAEALARAQRETISARNAVRTTD